jgi:hypothetical protein
MAAPTVALQTLNDSSSHVTVKAVIPIGGDADVTAAAMIDVSGLTPTPTTLVIEEVVYSTSGFSIILAFDADTDDNALILAGNGTIDLREIGGIPDPQSTGFTGDLFLSTDSIAGAEESGFVIVKCRKT